MELLKAILALITSFFNKSTVETKKEVKLADAVEKGVIENIRATTNAEAVQQQAKVQEALNEVREKHKGERDEAKKDPNSDDKQFGSDW